MVLTPTRSEGMGITPFYTDSDLSVKDFALIAGDVFRTIYYLGKYWPVIVVDDGDRMRGSLNMQDVVRTVKLTPHGGKAEAVRFGIAEALAESPKIEYLIQADFDGDPNPRQAMHMVRQLRRRGVSGNDYAMVLGERDEALKKKGYLDAHRTAIFALQQKFCAGLGYPHLTDPTTGLRVYTRKLAEYFLALGKAQNFGSDVEQLILARLVGADVFSVKLSETRRRGDHTSATKFRDCQDALLLHKQELSEIGLGKLLKVFGGDVSSLKSVGGTQLNITNNEI